MTRGRLVSRQLSRQKAKIMFALFKLNFYTFYQIEFLKRNIGWFQDNYLPVRTVDCQFIFGQKEFEEKEV